MKQKYVVMLENENNRLVIQEYAELDKEMLSLLCEEAYDLESIKTAKDSSRTALIQTLRTHNMYPPAEYMEQIAEAIGGMLEPGANPSAELFFEEKELFKAVEEEILDDEDENDDEDSGLGVDELLDDDQIEENYTDKDIPKNLKKSMPLSNEDAELNNG